MESINCDAGVRCDVCGNDAQASHAGTLEAKWEATATQAAEHYRVQLCRACFFQTLANLRQERRINTMFDEQSPVDDSAFGLVRGDAV